jgi:hypothetical protein
LYLERIRKEISLEKVKSFSEGYREAMKQNQKDAIIELYNMDKDKG